jgi:hypothetical protein
VSGYLLEDSSGRLLLEDSSGIYLLEDATAGVAGRVLIAFDDPALEPTPAWTRIDNNTAFRVSDITIRRGRQTEFDQTETSTATVTVRDPSGVFDPNNMSSPYFGKLNGKQIMLQLQNPVTGVWHTQFRGHIDDYGYYLSETLVLSTVQIECVDLFDYLARVEMVVGLFGDPALSVGDSAGVVVYAETDFQTRLEQAATDAGLPPEFFVFFTGNVDVQETKYDPGDSVMMVMRDAVDAEFPTAANIYTDKLGRVVGHGRYARFTPEAVAATGDWTFTRWDAATGGAVISGVAQIRPPLRFANPRSRIVNAAISYPRGIAEADIPGQIVIDTTSRDEYGYGSWSATDLITLAGTTTGNTANQETKLYGSYMVANYKEPRPRVEALTFKSIDPDDSRAAATWALMCGADISDVVNVVAGYPGGVGIAEDFYVEGSEMTIIPLNPGYDMVELSLNVSPAAYFTDNVFS